MICIDGHTIDENILGSGWIVDLGSRWFNLSKAFPEKKILAVDIENFNEIPPNTTFINAAITDFNGKSEAYFFGDGSANFVKGINQEPGNLPDRPCEKREVNCITLEDIYTKVGNNIDLLKADVEGFEYFIFKDFRPIPKMISIEFHQHCHEHLHNQYFEIIIEHLCKHYHFHAFNIGTRYRYLDCLFVRKDLL